MNEIDFDALRAEIDRKQADLEVAERRLAAVTTTARSADGLAEVTVSAGGAVTSVRLAPETFGRCTPENLGKSVTQAAQQATREVRRSAQAAVAPIAAIGRGIAGAVEESRAERSRLAPAQTVDTDSEASSTDRSVRVRVDPLGIVAVVHISPDVYRSGSITRLAAAITEAAERAARQMFETRMGALESAIGVEAPNMDEFFPVPVAPPAPPTYIPPAVPPPPSAPPVAGWDPRSGKPGEKVVGPSDWDDDMEGYAGGQRSWMV